jgi:hypothetical protein
MNWFTKMIGRFSHQGRIQVYWIVAALVFLAAPIYLAIRPTDYTPSVQVLTSVTLFWLALQIGFRSEIEKARQLANDRWLPQAESVIYRLMTLHANVKRLSCSTKSSCASTSCDLPELDQNNMQAVKVKLKTDCETASQRLDDIAHQVEDAIGDWHRFVSANCQGHECNRIFEALVDRQQKLLAEISNLETKEHAEDSELMRT